MAEEEPQESARVMESLSGSYLVLFPQAFGEIRELERAGAYEDIVHVLDFIYSILPSWLRDKLGQRPSKELQTRLRDFKTYSFSKVLHVKDTWMTSNMSPLSDLQKADLMEERAMTIIRDYTHDFLERVVDLLDEHGMLLSLEYRITAADLPSYTDFITNLKGKSRWAELGQSEGNS
jgi:hypothetical protein